MIDSVHDVFGYTASICNVDMLTRRNVARSKFDSFLWNVIKNIFFSIFRDYYTHSLECPCKGARVHSLIYFFGLWRQNEKVPLVNILIECIDDTFFRNSPDGSLRVRVFISLISSMLSIFFFLRIFVKNMNGAPFFLFLLLLPLPPPLDVVLLLFLCLS